MIRGLVIVLLMAAVSPVAAAVCEVTCASPQHARHGAAPVEVVAATHDHAHHHHDMAPPAPVSPVHALGTSPAPDCDLTTQLPARVRGVAHDAGAHQRLWVPVFGRPDAMIEASAVAVFGAPPPVLPPLLSAVLRL